MSVRRRPTRPSLARRWLGVVAALGLLWWAPVARSEGPSGDTPAVGYWLVASDGGIFAYGDAGFFGSTGAMKLNQPIVGMAPTGSGQGYWLVASDGGIFAFGDAGFFGSTGSIKLNQPIVGMAPTASGQGYWLVAADGGIFAFGDAGFLGSGASTRPAGQRVMDLTATPSGDGYWMVTDAGTVLAFGEAAQLGSPPSPAGPVAGMAATSTGDGYWLVGRDGAIRTFGDAPFLGSPEGVRLNRPIVGMAPRLAVRSASSGPGSSGPTGSPPSGPAPTTPPSSAPGPSPGQASGGYPASSLPPEAIDTPLRSPNSGGAHSHELPVSGTSCGLPEAPGKTVLPPDTALVGEGSGMVASTRYPGVHWVIRDSGHTAAVNALRFDAQGGVQSAREIMVPGAFNGDWEEVQYGVGRDGRARLWVVESGQPTPTGVYRQIYEILEPDPDTATSAELLHTYDYAYPDGGSYNTEASFMAGGYLVLATKTTPHARLFRFERLTPGVVNRPVLLGELGNSKDVSVIRQSPDGRLLVTASHKLVHLYRSTDGTGSLKSLLGRMPDCELRAFPDGNVEAGEFTANRQMLFLDELKVTYRLPLSD